MGAKRTPNISYPQPTFMSQSGRQPNRPVQAPAATYRDGSPEPIDESGMPYGVDPYRSQIAQKTPPVMKQPPAPITGPIRLAGQKGRATGSPRIPNWVY